MTDAVPPTTPPAPESAAHLGDSGQPGYPVDRKTTILAGTDQQVELARPSQRLAARLIDIALFTAYGVVILLLMAIFLFGGDGFLFGGDGKVWMLISLLVLIYILLVFGYEIVMTAIKGQTLGKMALRIGVVRADNGGIPGFGKSLGRWALPSVASWVFFPAGLLIYSSLLWDDNYQGWHDKAVGTLVVVKDQTAAEILPGFDQRTGRWERSSL